MAEFRVVSKIRCIQGEEEGKNNWDTGAADHSIGHTILYAYVLRAASKVVNNLRNQRSVHPHVLQLLLQWA